ncbi:hypothetical protein CBR_g34825 [Chara braunii]|uniref:Protein DETOXIFICATION n=1 Tax=Chara braunii TaxID=69332 RepID=A0A388LJF7_CHABU|nr:hypothetical protein CBR_g34825 [Chara braunii]|eukprot:GBG82448.1 hypothetical protein CBR_g34825 [Chara braunii]
MGSEQNQDSEGVLDGMPAGAAAAIPVSDLKGVVSRTSDGEDVAMGSAAGPRETCSTGRTATCLENREFAGPPELPRFLPGVKDGHRDGGDRMFMSLNLFHIWVEFNNLWKIAAPTALANLLWFVRVLISIMYLGRLKEVELAGSVLAISFADVTGVSLVLGLATGMDAICSQAFGARNYKLLQLTLQRSIIILQCVAAFLIVTVWLNVDSILILLGQDPAMVAVTKNYLFLTIPDLVSYALIIPLRTYLRSQCITIPLSICACIVLAIHIPLNYVLIFKAGLGYKGAAVATVITDTNFALLLVLVIWLRTPKEGPSRWHGWSWECLKEWRPILKLGVPSCVSIVVEWWSFELLNILAGLLPSPDTNVAAMSILLNCSYTCLMAPMGVSVSASTRVGMELGANEPWRARLAAFVAWLVGGGVGVINMLIILLFGSQLASLFTNIHSVQLVIAEVMPLLGVTELFFSPQYVGGGILRGCARPNFLFVVSIVAFYCIGLPLAICIVFVLHFGVSGLMWGLLSAESTACLAVTAYAAFIDWDNEAKRAQLLVKGTEIAKSADCLTHNGDKLAHLAAENAEKLEGSVNNSNSKWDNTPSHDNCDHTLTVPLLHSHAEDQR